MGTGIGEILLYGAVAGVASQVVGNLLAPKPSMPQAPAVKEMPDPLAQQEAMKRKIIEQTARTGRASTILTSPSGGKLGG